jgi:tungstate transport system substrate-binding protein
MSKRKTMRLLKHHTFKGIVLLALLSSLLSFAACGKSEPVKPLTLATTTSVNDSGLLGVLKPAFEKETGISLKIVAQGTGQAVKTGENGDADVLLIHDRKSEDKFVSDGDGIKRIEIMYNYFVMVGPKDDPAGIKSLGDKNAAEAFKQVMDKKIPFISRGDNSGTNSKEISIWKSKNINPSGDWYISAGKGMGDVLSMASEKKAYTLTDKATYLSMKDKLDLQIVLENSKDMLNQYTVIGVNPDKHPSINKKGADQFIKWITSDKTLKLISDYGKDKFGVGLFTVDYKK